MATQRTKRKARDEPSIEHDVLEITNAGVVLVMERENARVLDDVSVNVRHGEVPGVVGESDSDKSMLAGSMLDIIDFPGMLIGDAVFNPPRGGEPIEVNELSKEELRRLRWERVLMMIQGVFGSFNPTLSISDHFVETLRTHNYDIQEGVEHARQLISDAYPESDRILDAYLHKLSGGMKQHALIVPSLAPDPGVPAMNESTAVFDLLMQRPTLRLLSELKAEYDPTIATAMRDLSHVARISDRLAVMYAFRLLELGPAQDIIMDPVHPYTWELLSSIPDIDVDLDEMVSIEGTSLGPPNVPKGCSHHTRYPLADERCRATNPDLMKMSDNHGAAYFYTNEVRETIPPKKEASR